MLSWEVLSPVLGDRRRRVSISSGLGCFPLDYVLLGGGVACSEFLVWVLLVHWLW